MEILDLLTLGFCVLAVVLNAATCFVLLKRKSGKGAPAYSLIFASLAFIFIILGCLGYLFSDYAIAMPATLALSGLCLLIYFATEKAPMQSFEGAAPNRESPDLSFLMKKTAEPDAQAPEGDADFGIDVDSLIADSSSLNADGDSGYSSADFDSLLDEPSPLDDDGDISYEDLGISFDELIAQSSSSDAADPDLGFSADDLDDLDDDFDLDFSLDMELSDDDFDAVFPPDDDDALFVDALLDDDDIEASPVPVQDAEDDGLSDDAVLDEEFEADFEFPQEDEALLPAAEPSLEEESALEGADGFAEAADIEGTALFEGAAADALAGDDEERILKAGQELIAQVSQSMRGGVKLEALLDFANRTLIENTGADGGIIFLVDDYEDVLNAKALSGDFPPPYKLPDDIPHKEKLVEASLRHAQLSFEGNIFGEAALSGEALCIEDGESDPRVYQNVPEPFLAVGSYIIAPLAANDKIVGVAGLARPPHKEPFSQKDFKAAKALAGYAAAAVSNVYSFQEIMERAELESGVEAAAKIQKTFLPKKLPELPEAGFGFYFKEAKGVCTDYCDVIFARRDRIALVVADVAGKGIISGMIMTSLRALLHLVTNTTKSVSTILDWVNKSIADKNIDIDHYAALSYVSYSLETNELEYASAGHQAMLMWRAAEGRVETVSTEGETLGVDRNTEFKERKLTAAPGDIIILYTDGLVEAINPQGEQYGVSGLSKAVAGNSEASAKEIAAAVRRDLKDFTGSATLHDDQTLLVMKIKNP